MRFVFLVVGAAATGALSVSAITTFAPQTAQTFHAVTALGGDLRNFKVDINPIGKVYQSVMQQVTAGQPSMVWQQGPALTMTPIDVSKLGFGKIDEEEMRRFNAQGMASQIQDNTRRMQDISAYMRNPAGWRGLPPH
ncbi:MAG TPA: hypothetical protein VMR17_20905 [Xanthobacteraceae bacterium]|jgi:hypothetical protein|nr:hypothetical protein [Xanthobacteraceae bacterium]